MAAQRMHAKSPLHVPNAHHPIRARRGRQPSIGRQRHVVHRPTPVAPGRLHQCLSRLRTPKPHRARRTQASPHTRPAGRGRDHGAVRRTGQCSDRRGMRPPRRSHDGPGSRETHLLTLQLPPANVARTAVACAQCPRGLPWPATTASRPGPESPGQRSSRAASRGGATPCKPVSALPGGNSHCIQPAGPTKLAREPARGFLQPSTPAAHGQSFGTISRLSIDAWEFAWPPGGWMNGP